MLTLRYNEPVFILMLRGRGGCLRQPTLPLSISSESVNTKQAFLVPGGHPLDYSLKKLRAKFLLLISSLYLVSKFGLDLIWFRRLYSNYWLLKRLLKHTTAYSRVSNLNPLRTNLYPSLFKYPVRTAL